MLFIEMNERAAWATPWVSCIGFIVLINSTEAMRRVLSSSLAFIYIEVKLMPLCDKLRTCWATTCSKEIEALNLSDDSTYFRRHWIDGFIDSCLLQLLSMFVRIPIILLSKERFVWCSMGLMWGSWVDVSSGTLCASTGFLFNRQHIQ